NSCEQRMIHARKRTELRIGAGACDFFFRQFDQALESCHIARLKKRIRQHRRQRWCDRKRQPEIDTVPDQVVEYEQKRNIGFRNCFEEPVLLQRLLLIGFTDEWQVRMKNQREITWFHFFESGRSSVLPS